MSDRLTFSAVLSVLMMTAYVLLGSEAVKAPFGPAELESPRRVVLLQLPSFGRVLARAEPRPILY